MQRFLFLISLLSFSFLLPAQTGLVSGELNVTTFPTNNGDGTFTLTGNFADPKGLYFAADVAAGMSLWKGNNYFRITAASANGSTLDLTVEDTYSIGFLGTGIYSIGEETDNLRLPGVSTTGDSNPALSTPPDYAAKFNYILTLIDQGIPGTDTRTSVADTATVVNPTDGDVLISPDTLSFFDGSQWISVAFSGEDDVTENTGPPSGAPGGNPLIYQNTDTGEIYTWGGTQWNNLTVVASNGLTKTGTDVELGGTLEQNTDVEIDAFTLRLGKLIGSLPAYLRIVPATAGIDLFTRDNTASTEASLDLSPGSAIIGAADATNETQVVLNSTTIDLVTNESASLQNRIRVNNEKVELQVERLELKTPDAGSSAVGDVLTLLDPVSGESDFRPAATGLSQYEAAGVNGAVDLGSFVTATGTGITYERTGGSGQNTEGILTVPTDAILQGLSVHFSSGQAPGNTFYLNVDYQNSGRDVNGTQDSVMPIWATVATKPTTFSDAAPATNYIHSGTPLQIGISQVDDNGTRTRIRYKITNYSQQAGSNASILSIAFP